VVASEKVLATRGVLNVVRPTQQHDPHSGLLLIGGPSAACDWSDERMLEQIATIVDSTPSIRWRLADSRRTPPSFLKRVAQKKFENLQVTPHQETTPGWVPQQLANASQVWVSEESVSMVYEALTSGAAVGILKVPSKRRVSGKRRGRVAAGVDLLVENGWVTRFANWPLGSRLAPPPAPLDEARRCAEIIFQRMLLQAAA